ncbi:MAG: PilZ domain-containing protein [Elusimicrobia bacterium]|nr:PilZ domain-containing protein [Elusimicrobiota bacterium]
MDIEKRKFPRQLVSLSTNLLETETEKVLGDCILTDISKVGFAFESETKFHIGQKFNLELTILNQKISLTGKVVRICEGVFYQMYGVEIIDGDSKNLDFFRRYIDYSLN